MDGKSGLPQPVAFFHNLLLNARQAVPEGGVVDVRAENVIIDDAVPFISAGKYVRILVRDNGCGIPEEILPKIFDPYFTTRTLFLRNAHAIICDATGSFP